MFISLKVCSIMLTVNNTYNKRFELCLKEVIYSKSRFIPKAANLFT